MKINKLDTMIYKILKFIALYDGKITLTNIEKKFKLKKNKLAQEAWEIIIEKNFVEINDFKKEDKNEM